MWFTAFDIIGTVAFAYSGFVAGARRQLDLLGVVIVAFLTASAGGVVNSPPKSAGFIIFCFSFRIAWAKISASPESNSSSTDARCSDLRVATTAATQGGIATPPLANFAVLASKLGQNETADGR